MFTAVYQRLINSMMRNNGNTKHETEKLLFLTLSFFCSIGAYTILRSLKSSIFLGMVGKEYLPMAKLIGLGFVIPVMYVYAKLVDKVKRHQVVYACFALYTTLALLAALYLLHPVYGIANTVTSPYRWFGWVFEFSMDLFQALVVGSFWSYITSISTPKFAAKHYGSINAWSRISGCLAAMLGMVLIEKAMLSELVSIPLLTAIAGLLLLCGGLCVRGIVNAMPASELEGYEAHAHHKPHTKNRANVGFLAGLRLLLTQPYVMGIFLLTFGFEVVNAIFDYQMHVVISLESGNNIKSMTLYMLIYGAAWQALGFPISYFGTSGLLQSIGIRLCLLLPPFLIGSLVVMIALVPSIWSICIAMVCFRAIHYGFSQPIREMLFIPTVKDIQFKSKAWIESIGRTMSKTTGNAFNEVAASSANPFITLVTTSAVSFVVVLMWMTAALFVGRTYEHTIKKEALIGEE